MIKSTLQGEQKSNSSSRMSRFGGKDPLIIMSANKRIPLLLNPRARSAKADGIQRFVMENAIRFAIYATRSSNDAQELAHYFSEQGEPIIIAAGGDGTLNAVINGLVGSQTTLGILPAGTMNVFARELGLPVDGISNEPFRKALAVIDRGETVEVDLFTMNDAPFVQMAGVGFDAQIIADTKWETKKALGPLAYLWTAAKVLGNAPPKMQVTIDDGQTIDGVAVLIGNGSLYGGHVRLFGNANNSDHLLDILVFKEAGYKLVLDTIAGLAKGGFNSHADTVSYHQSKGLRIKSDRQVPVEIDGELWGHADEFTFTRTPQKLNVLAPKEVSMPYWEEMLRTVTPWTPTPD